MTATPSDADFDLEVAGAESATLQYDDENSSTASFDHEFAIVLLLFLGILIGVCLIGRRH